ncbi:MAG TPA: Fur family transcriptional regulator [Vicinamibacteria bacterium]|nr:Fur family transcriptional regulator [Vicinamibacteria bacterium]
MDDRTKAERLELLRRLCRERGLVLTPQRRAILRAVLDADDHPTADRVHAALARRRVRVSRATVYRTLESLARVGLVSKACHPGSAVRYDRRIDRHHHLVCLRCDRVMDFSDERFDAVPVPNTRRLGFVVSDLRVQVRGICRECREQEDKR